MFALIGSAYGIWLDRAASAFTLASPRLLFDRGASGVKAQRGAVATCNQYVNSGTSGGVLAEDYNTMIAGAAHASNLTHSQPVDAALQRSQRSVMVAA